jgi:hypothetical protein
MDHHADATRQAILREQFLLMGTRTFPDLLLSCIVTELLWGVSPMTTKTTDSAQERTFDRIAREQFDALRSA